MRGTLTKSVHYHKEKLPWYEDRDLLHQLVTHYCKSFNDDNSPKFRNTYSSVENWARDVLDIEKQYGALTKTQVLFLHSNITYEIIIPTQLK